MYINVYMYHMYIHVVKLHIKNVNVQTSPTYDI